MQYCLAKSCPPNYLSFFFYFLQLDRKLFSSRPPLSYASTECLEYLQRKLQSRIYTKLEIKCLPCHTEVGWCSCKMRSWKQLILFQWITAFTWSLSSLGLRNYFPLLVRVIVTCPLPHEKVKWLQPQTERLWSHGPFQLCLCTTGCYVLCSSWQPFPFFFSNICCLFWSNLASSFSFNCAKKMKSIWLGNVSSESQKYVS